VPETKHKSVLVLAPHPDDETFGCGGTIRMLSESDVAVDVVFMTRGEQGTENCRGNDANAADVLADVRAREAQAACDELGVRKLAFLDGRDTCLMEQRELAGKIADILAHANYQRVFCPWPRDGHRDHQATFDLLRRAVLQTKALLSFWLYEVWTPLPANTFVPIDRTVETKRRAMSHYKSQLSQFNYQEGFVGLAAYRSLFCPPARFVEAFLVCNTNELDSVAKELP
jgi:N-acetylglucosamine malate deacetylase 1